MSRSSRIGGRVNIVAAMALLSLAAMMSSGLAGCSGSGKTPATTGSSDSSSSSTLDSASVTLGYGQSTTLPFHPDETIQFTDVPAESRCPIGVQCPWEGDAAVTLVVSQTSSPDTTHIELHTNSRFATTATYKDMQIHLAGLEPYPHEGTKISLQDYTAKLTVTHR